MATGNNIVLIVSLSKFPERLTPCRYIYPVSGKTVKGGVYYYQQEPFPMYLKDRMKSISEILILCTPETRAQTTVYREGEELAVSPEEYFTDSVRALGMEDVLLSPIEVDQDNPSSAVSAVVEHLRALKKNNKSPEIWLGTNGGLRGQQLILEAILSLLSVDQISVSPDHVLGMRFVKKEERETVFEICSSAAEFRIFDFVSGIKEFINYGRIASLESFLQANPEINDESTKQLMRCLNEVSIGIQFGSTKTFETGLTHLSEYVRLERISANPYLELFRETIINDFGELLRPEECHVTDKIKWCCKKGFWVQAYTLVESVLPREYIDLGIVTYDEDSARLIKKEDWKGDRGVALFNLFLDSFQKHPEWTKFQINDSGESRRHSFSITLFRNHNKINDFKAVLKEHVQIKTIRNGLVHSYEDGGSVKDHQRQLEQYIRNVQHFYKDWEKQSRTYPILSIKLDE